MIEDKKPKEDISVEDCTVISERERDREVEVRFRRPGEDLSMLSKIERDPEEKVFEFKRPTISLTVDYLIFYLRRIQKRVRFYDEHNPYFGDEYRETMAEMDARVIDRVIELLKNSK